MRGALPFAIVNNNAKNALGRAFCYPELQDALNAGEKCIFVSPSDKDYKRVQFTSSHNGTVVYSSFGAIFTSVVGGAAVGHCFDFSGCSEIVCIGLRGRTKGDGATTYTIFRATSSPTRIFLMNCWAENSDHEGFMFDGGETCFLIGCIGEDTYSAKPPLEIGDYCACIGCVDDGNHNGNPFVASGKGMFVGCIDTGSGYGPWISGADNLLVGNLMNGGVGGGYTSSTIANNEEY